jgi:hypothetical protein
MASGFRRTGLGLAALALALTGCAPKAVKVNGRLLKGGQPMVVSEDTYVTLSFVPDGAGPRAASSHSARFDPKSGAYSVELPAGRYRTMLVVALPPKKEAKGKESRAVNAPSRPVTSDKVYDLTADQVLDIEVPGK